MPKAQTRTRRFVINNMTGLLNTVSEANALVGIDPNASYGVAFTQAKCEFSNIDNWMPLNRGGMSKTSGFEEYYDTGRAAPITGIYRFVKADGTTKFLFSQTADLYTLTAGVEASIYSSLKSGSYTHFETAYDECIICDGETSRGPIVYDGSAVSTLIGSPPNGAKSSLFTNDRLFIQANDGYVYYSDASEVNTASPNYNANLIQCDVEDGQKVTCLSRFFLPGDISTTIFVGKERSVGIIDGTGTGSDPFTFKKVQFDTGIAGFRHAQQFGTDIAYLTQKGITSLKTTVQDVNLTEDFLSERIRTEFTEASQTYYANALSWQDWKNQRISFAVPTGSSQYANTIYHYDTGLKGWYKQTGFNVTAAFVDTNGDIYFGTDGGKIHKFSSSVNNYDSAAIVATMRTANFDFFDPVNFKRVINATVKVRGNGANTLGIRCFHDWGSKTGSSHTVALSSGNYVWGGGVWTSDPNVYQWGAAPLQTFKFYPRGIFKTLALEFTQSNANQAVDIYEITFDVEYLTTY